MADKQFNLFDECAVRGHLRKRIASLRPEGAVKCANLAY